MADNPIKAGTVDVEIKLEDLTDDQKEYIRLVTLGQKDDDAIIAIRDLIAPQLTPFKQVDVALALNYLTYEIFHEYEKSEASDDLMEKTSSIASMLFHVKGTHKDRKEKGLDNTN